MISAAECVSIRCEKDSSKELGYIKLLTRRVPRSCRR